MNETEVKSIYKCVLQKIRSENVAIKRDCHPVLQNSKYQYRRTIKENNFSCPHITVYRPNAPGFLDQDTQFNDLFSDCSNHLDELICLAHELGHHFSPDPDIDSLYDKIRDNGNCAIPEDKQKILNEESFAWDKAKSILGDLGFPDWDSFEKSKNEGLQSYKNNIHQWLPLSIPELLELLQALRCKWLFAGGWALDTFLEKQTREHSDIDVLIARNDQLELQKHLKGWDLQVGDPPGTLRPWKSEEFLNQGIHDIWGRPENQSPWKIQFMLFDVEKDEWIYRRNKSIRGPLNSMSLKSKGGLSYLAPEIQLLYKSKGLRSKDKKGF